jgi:hypothetical protein
MGPQVRRRTRRAGGTGKQDVFAVERGAERRFGARVPLAAMVPGYGRNREAALAILAWLDAHVSIDPALAAAIRELAQIGSSDVFVHGARGRSSL